MKNEKPTRKTAAPSSVDYRRGVYGGFVPDDTTIPIEAAQGSGKSVSSCFIPAPPSANICSSRSQLPSSEQGGEDGEFTTNWTPNSSYRGYSGGNRFRRYRSDNTSFRQTEANGLIRNYSTHGRPKNVKSDLYYTEGEPMRSSDRRGNSTIVRSASSPASRSVHSYGSSHNHCLSGRSDLYYDSQTIRSSSFHIKGKSWLDIPISLAAVLSDEQAARLRTCLNSGSTLKNRAKMKILEFLEYWLSDEGTCAAIDVAITDVFRKAGIENLYSSRNVVPSDECHTPKLFPEKAFTHREVQGVKSVDSETTSPTHSSAITSEKNILELPMQGCKHDAIASRNGVKHATLPLQLSGSSSKERWATRLCSRSPPAFPSSPQTTAAIPITVETCSPERARKTPITEPEQKKVSLLTATVEEIPRFYHPRGAPISTEESLVGPKSKKHENPHLKIVDGIVLPAPVYDAQEDKSPMVGGLALPKRKDKTVSIAPLRAIDDKEAPQFIQNEFNRLSSRSKVSHSSHLLGSFGKIFIGGRTSSTLNKQGNYKQQLVNVIQRICTQCLGLPKYFAFLIIRILQHDTDRANARTVYFRENTSPGASSSHITLGSHSTITAQGMRELFEKRLRGHCIVRRLFDILQLSSLTDSSTSPCSNTNRIDTEQKYQLRSFLLPEDFRAYIKVLLDHHPGLAFLKQTPDFQIKYLETVIYRIFYDIDRLDRGRITYAEMENSRLPDALRYVDAADDINSVLLYFSYEHFYVLYCRFWELDGDRDMLISREDFLKYAPENVMNPLIADRIFAGVGRRISCGVKNCIGYEDFVWFCLSEEDKSTPTAIRYWFRILDLDGDGLLSAYELQIFYEATKEKVVSYVPDAVTPFENVICQIFDLFGIKSCCGLRLADLLAKPEAASVALNMLTNVVRFLMFEHQDPLVSHHERLQGGVEQTPWDYFARAEYDSMSHEVTGS